MQNDLDFAKKRLIQKDLSLVIVKNFRVLFETQSRGIKGMLEAIKELGKDMRCSSVVDRVVGRAAALLLVFSGAISVYAVTISDEGIKIFEKFNMPYEFNRRVPKILNSKKTDVCPFEGLVTKVSDPKEAYEMLRGYCDSHSF